MKQAGNIEGAFWKESLQESIGSGHGNFELPAGILNWSSEDVKFGVTTREDESLERKYRVREKKGKKWESFYGRKFT